MTNDSKIHTLAGGMATLIVTVSAIAGVAYMFHFFSSAREDITLHDLKIEVVQQGTGEGAKRGDTVLINYITTLTDGTQVDNSYSRKTPVYITLGDGNVIKGWENGLFGMKKGEKRRLTIPSSLGYGEKSVPDGKGGYLIPPNSTLIFEVEMIEITKH